METKFYTFNETLEILRIKTRTLRAWIKKGVIPAYKFEGNIRFKVEDVDKWIDARKCL